MRKALGIVIGCSVLGGLVMVSLLAQEALPTPTVKVTINGDFQTDGVDQPWFVLSKGARNTVQWKNETGVVCTLSFGDYSPFTVEPIKIPKRQSSQVLEPTEAPEAPPKDKLPDNGIYKVYKYSVKCGGTTFDPGWGVTP